VNFDRTSLTRFQRMLLGTDGTVTHILEAYAEEPIEVVKLLQVFDTSKEEDGALLLVPEGPVLRRRVVLRGRHSRRNLLYAEAVVAVDRIGSTFLEGLTGSDKPIGVLLSEHRIETYREILSTERRAAGPSGAHFHLDPAAVILSRTYRIISGGKPILVIMEMFAPELGRLEP
jgi:chorismate-pyruvate lyase